MEYNKSIKENLSNYSGNEPNEYFKNQDTFSLYTLSDQSNELLHPTPVRRMDIESLEFLEPKKTKFLSMKISKTNGLPSPDKQYQSLTMGNNKNLQKKARILDAMCKKFDLCLNSNFGIQKNKTVRIPKIQLPNEDLIQKKNKLANQAQHSLSGKNTQKIPINMIKEVHTPDSTKNLKLVCNNNFIKEIDRCSNPIS